MKIRGKCINTCKNPKPGSEAEPLFGKKRDTKPVVAG
jgi:hypothetical protein